MTISTDAHVITSADTNWQRTLTIDERIQLPGVATLDDDTMKWERWLQLAAFKRPEVSTEEGISPLGVDVCQLQAIINESESSLQDRAFVAKTPEWAEQLATWWNDPRLADVSTEQGEHGLLNAIEDLVTAAQLELADNLYEAAWPHGLDATSALHSLIGTVPVEQFGVFVIPTMVRELHRLRMNDRIDEFTALCQTPQYRKELLERYPVMWKLVVGVLTNWVCQSILFVERFLSDIGELAKCFATGSDMTVSSVRFMANQGDAHNEGATVTIVETDSFRCVYKPRQATGDELVGEICSLLERAGATDLPCVPALLVRDDYFWQEYVAAVDVTEENAGDLASSLGSMCAILYALQAEDVHHENVVLAQQGAVPIDLECVLHTMRPTDLDLTLAKNPASMYISRAATSLGIVPQPIISNAGGETTSADISVFGYSSGTRLGVQVPQLRDFGKSTMRLVQGDAVFTDDDPSGNRQLLLDHTEEFISAFRSCYRTILGQVDGILDVVERYSSRNVRLICRPTMIYSKVLTESCHPDFLGDERDHTLCLSKLLVRFLGQPFRNPLIMEEIAALRTGYIPHVTVEIGTGILETNGHRFEGVVAPMAAIRDRMRELSIDDLDKQVSLIELSFATRQVRGHQVPPTHTRRSETADRSGEVVEAAEDMLAWTEKNMYEWDGLLGHTTLTALTPTIWAITPSGLDLYNGLSGVVRAADSVAKVSNSEVADRLLVKLANTFKSLDHLLTNDQDAVDKNVGALNVGAYDQIAGIALANAVFFDHFGDEDYQDSVRRALLMLAQMCPSDLNSDIISGAAGALLVASSLEQYAPNEAALAMKQAFLALKRNALVGPDHAVCWKNGGDESPLAGFSHGASGIASALSLLIGREGFDNAEVLQLIEGALTWEKKYYRRGLGWSDLREDGGSQGMQTWCHGAAGAALARAQILDSAGSLLDPRVKEQLTHELSDAFSITVVHTSQMIDQQFSDCLCHGSLGNLIVLDRLLERSEFESQGPLVDALWDRALTEGRLNGWKSGAIGGCNSMSFMMGIPGIAWGLAYSQRQAPALDVLSLGVR